MDITLNKHVNQLMNYGLNTHLFEFTQLQDILNRLKTVLACETLTFGIDTTVLDIDVIMKPILDYGYQKHLFSVNSVTKRDAFEAKIMDAMMPEPLLVKAEFARRFHVDPSMATAYLYDLSVASNYIKVNRLKQNIAFTYSSVFGPLHITINLAKPEKDPKDIALLKLTQDISNGDMPACVLCKENERNYHHARMNLRIVPITLADELWHFQFSPYLYFNHHAIILHDDHRPMHICEKTMDYLVDFVDQFPGYFIGSNADLPIVGGSILNHDHFQAGKAHFPIEKSTHLATFDTDGDDIELTILNWPLSTIRLKTHHVKLLKRYAKKIMMLWQTYSDKDSDIYAFSNDEPHNTITPILRKKDGFYEMDLILRNNRRTQKHPLGRFHPHEDVWHIKKENIGLIEAMGLAILPGRLKDELNQIIIYLNDEKTVLPKPLKHHQPWFDWLKHHYPNATLKDIEHEVGAKFEKCLRDAGVFALDKVGIKGFKSFVYESLHHIRSTRIHQRP